MSNPPVYALVENANAQLNDVYNELNVLGNVYPEDPQIQSYLSARLTKMYNRANTLTTNINTYMSDFAGASPSIMIPENHVGVLFSLHPKYLDALKTYSSEDLAPLWSMCDNSSDNAMKTAAIYSFCDL